MYERNILEVILSNNGRDSEQMTAEQVINAMVQVAEALQYMHSRHVVHSDVRAIFIYVCHRNVGSQ